MNNPKCCPFCEHDKASVVTILRLLPPFIRHQVECRKCGARGPSEKTRRQAVISWNLKGVRVLLLGKLYENNQKITGLL